MACFVAETLLPEELKLPNFAYSRKMFVFQAFPFLHIPCFSAKNWKIGQI
jgi:hypothetical protein